MEREDAWPWAGDREAHAADAGRTTLQTQGSLPSPTAALGSGLPLETGLLPLGRSSICPKELRPHCGQDQSVTSKPGQLTNACRQTPDLLELFPDRAGIWWWTVPVSPCRLNTVQFSSVASDSLRPHESQHARPPCPSSTPGVHSDSRPSSQ